jgi:DNA-directed RNA polymerase specialized sigma24 family protein
MNLWAQYNPERSLGGYLQEYCKMPLAQCKDKELFEALKRHLTRRELRCLVMDEGGCTKDAIAEEAGMSCDNVEKVLHKGRKKLRQPKLQQDFRTLLTEADGEEG